MTYAGILADICLNASTSAIQKRSLIGQNRDVTMVQRLSSQPECPLRSAGLIDLAFFNAVQEPGHDGETIASDFIPVESKLRSKAVITSII